MINVSTIHYSERNECLNEWLERKSAKELNNINKSLHHNFPPGSSNLGTEKSAKNYW